MCFKILLWYLRYETGMTYKGSSAGQLWRAGHREQELGELVTGRKGPDCWSQGARVGRTDHREEG